MKLFIDTANIDEIREAASWGILDGCTTNPSLIAKEGRNFAEAIAAICDIVQGPVSAEVVAQDTEGMLREAALLTAAYVRGAPPSPYALTGRGYDPLRSREGW